MLVYIETEAEKLPKPAPAIGRATPQLAQLAIELGLELVGIELCKEHGSVFLRIFVDREGGMTLNSCEAFHRKAIPFCEDIEYDYLEVSSPGADRPLKTQHDFDRASGKQVEVRFYQPINGVKTVVGELIGLENDEVVIALPTAQARYPRKAVALVKPHIDMSVLQEDIMEEPK